MKYVAKRQAELKDLYLFNKSKWEEEARKEEATKKERRAKHKCNGCDWANWEGDSRLVCIRMPCIKSN